MRILWITPVSSWTVSLAEILSKQAELFIICPGNEVFPVNNDNCKTCNLSLTKKEIVGQSLSNAIAQKYISVIQDFDPDIIHIHGTERNYGQLYKYIKSIPIVISIQGILKGCIPFVSNYISSNDIRSHKTLKNVLGQGGILQQKNSFTRRSNLYENEILKNCSYFFCRTHWDRAWVMFNNSVVKIYQGEELLRNAFYINASRWSIKNCKRHYIFMPSGFNPIKGLHLAIKAIGLLKNNFPDIILAVPGLPTHILSYGNIKKRLIGEEYVNYCQSLIKERNLENNIKLLPRLNAEEMANEMINANVFLSPTSIDNSPNSVGEAMMVGVPIVTTPVGGIPSMIKDEESCLYSPAGDEYIMAYQIKRIFDDDNLAQKLSKNAHQIALKRHDIQQTCNQYLSSYTDIIETHNKTKN